MVATLADGLGHVLGADIAREIEGGEESLLWTK